MALIERAVKVTTDDGVSLVGRALWQRARSPAGTLAGARGNAEVALVITHPYGPLGGNMDNNVVQAVYDAAEKAGFAAVCFNFRGVGRSTGRTSWRGTGEIEDVRAICKFMLGPPPEEAAVPVKALVLVGYSFGAAVAANVIDARPEILGYAGIGFPFSVLWALTLFNGGTVRDAIQRSAKPKLFVQGDADTFTSKASFTDALAQVAPTATVAWLPGCDHFFFDREHELVPIILSWIRSLVPSQEPTSSL